MVENLNIIGKDLSGLVEKIESKSIAVLGDFILDEFIYGKVFRMSREAPIPIITKEKEVFIPGGAGNAAHNVVTLSGKCYSIGTIGTDYSGIKLKETMSNLGIETEYLMEYDTNPTTTKTRISAASPQSVTQQVARLDSIPSNPLPSIIEDKIISALEKISDKLDTILISDYEMGVVTNKIIDKCIEISKTKNINLIVDSQGNMYRFQGATILTPNQPEVENVVGYEIKDMETLEKAGKELLEKINAENILITRGADGMALFEKDGSITHIPAFNKRSVYDVTGAGDTVVATIALALASGLTPKEAMYLSNLSASIVITRLGTSTTNIEEMKKVLST